MNSKFEKSIALIDAHNSEDPNTVVFEGKEYPKELLYAHRMTDKLLDIEAEASEALKIAIRAQHICRWKIERKAYPADRAGYFQWRNALKKMHADITSDLLTQVGYTQEFIDRVSFLINKKALKRDQETQTLEDVACLVFLEYYLEAFMAKHDDAKMVDILQKTWKKMSPKGQDLALHLNLSTRGFDLVKKALA